jgi:meiotic recombination protein SPO11
MRGSLNLQGILVPKLHVQDSLELTSIRWILVIEKEVCHMVDSVVVTLLTQMQATFRSLISSTQWACLGAHGLALTVC